MLLRGQINAKVFFVLSAVSRRTGAKQYRKRNEAERRKSALRICARQVFGPKWQSKEKVGAVHNLNFLASIFVLCRVSQKMREHYFFAGAVISVALASQLRHGHELNTFFALFFFFRLISSYRIKLNQVSNKTVRKASPMLLNQPWNEFYAQKPSA